MNKERLRRIILDGQEKIGKIDYIRRDLQVDFSALRTLNKIIAINGPRRAGKTFYIFQLIDNLGLKPEQVVLVDFSEIVLADFRAEDFVGLYSAYAELFPEEEPWFFFDEVQEVPSYESGLVYLLNRNCHTIITGSTAKVFSEELSSALRGKTLNYTIFPLSFAEFLRFKGFEQKETYSTRLQAELNSLLKEYITWGGFPEVVKVDNVETKKNIISTYIDVMLFRDIIERFNVKNIHLVELLFYKLLKSFTKEISVHKWYNDLKSMGIKVSKDSIYQYLSYFERSMFAVYILNYYGGPTSLRKVYFIDNGLYNLINIGGADYGKLLENQVFRDLFNIAPSLRFVKTRKWEVDFITNSSAYQVCFMISKENIKRETAGLKELIDKKVIKEGSIIVLEDSEDILEHVDIPIISYQKFYPALP